jgi:serine-type D-Ala-D-Ala carboxypeptidase/endopeptidase (penicillin-binding protein 4)
MSPFATQPSAGITVPWEGNVPVRRLSRLGTAALALMCVFTIGAGLTVARLLPHRLTLWRQPGIAAARLADPAKVLGVASGSPVNSGSATAAGVAAALTPFVSSSVLGPQLGVLVTNLATGRVLYDRNGSSGFTPGSTAKLATAVAALDVLGPTAKFRTYVVTGGSPSSIVLVGGGDPTLAAGKPPASDYPQPATLLLLAARTARALRAKGHDRVRLGYDTSLYTGPGLAEGWTSAYVTTGNVTEITPLEVDQGRLTATGAPEDADVTDTRPRSADPALEAATAFAGFLRSDGVSVEGAPTQATAPAGASGLASVNSPPLSEIVQWMLEQSNNVIAENVARHVAIATGHPASFSGAAAAVQATLRSLGVTSGVHLYDGSGLSVDDSITPDALVHLLRLAATRARLRSVLTSLPVANFSGTLSAGGSVFGTGGPTARGVVRAKTGNLSTIASLAGVAYAKNGQLLSFAVMADKIQAAELVPAASMLVNLAGALASCGCR